MSKVLIFELRSESIVSLLILFTSYVCLSVPLALLLSIRDIKDQSVSSHSLWHCVSRRKVTPRGLSRFSQLRVRAQLTIQITLKDKGTRGACSTRSLTPDSQQKQDVCLPICNSNIPNPHNKGDIGRAEMKSQTALPNSSWEAVRTVTKWTKPRSSRSD